MVVSNPSHARIIGSVMMREIVTKYGREGLGFLWLIGEPLMFCLAVIVMWSVIKPAYEHGLRVAPFVMTGYMCLLLLRHVISYNMGALQANVGLLHHRQITVLHIYIARNVLEFAGSTCAFVVVYLVLILIGQVSPPEDFLLLLSGWLMLFWLATGLAITLSALAMSYEVMDRIVPVAQYLLVPVTGTFFMVGWFSPHIRDIILLIPIPHAVEMVRGGVFGEFVETFYSPWYPFVWGAVLNFIGLLLLARAHHHIDLD